MQMTPPLWQKVKRNKGPLDESERGEWKSWLKTQKTKTMASSPITSRQIDGETMETVTGFLFLDSKITADGECSHEIKRHSLLGRKAMTNLDSILNNRDIADKGPSSQSYGFSNSHVWIWELDHKGSWVSKNWFLNCGVGEDSWESLGLQDPTSQS